MTDPRAVTVEVLRELIDYDPATGKMFWRRRERKWFNDNHEHPRWNTRYAGKECFNYVNAGYMRSKIFGKDYAAHRVAWALHHGAWPDGLIDHIDGDRQNNRIANLRVVTPLENSRNTSLGCKNTSGCLGVRFERQSGKWVASIRDAGRQIRLGSFAEKGDAVAVRKAAERELGYHPNHGRRATLPSHQGADRG